MDGHAPLVSRLKPRVNQLDAVVRSQLDEDFSFPDVGATQTGLLPAMLKFVER
jgi:hypothetical protein